MQILRASDHKQMPWKNGGGVTTQIAVAPKDAAAGDFHWRISMATVACDGPFSSFESIDRILTVLDGAGMDIAVAGMEPVRLTAASAPFSFPGDAATSARLVSGTITDLNVMTRRGKWNATVERLPVKEPCLINTGPGIGFLFCCNGNLEVSHNGSVLAKNDVLFVGGTDDTAAIAVAGIADIVVIRLSQEAPFR
jgi:uncharacterized protein